MRMQWISALIGLSLDLAVLGIAWHLFEPHVAFRHHSYPAARLQQICSDVRVERDAIDSTLNAASEQYARLIFSIERHLEQWKADR